MMQRWWMHFPLCPWGWRHGVSPAIGMHIAGTWSGNPAFVIIALALAITIAIAIIISIIVANSIAIAIVVAHHCCHRPLLLRLPLTIAATLSVALPSAQPLPSPSPSPLLLAIAVSVTISHCSCHLHWPSLPLLPLAISESCCLGVSRIVFGQLKQIMLTLFYFVCTVGGALIKAGWLTRCWAAMANISVGWQAASIEASG